MNKEISIKNVLGSIVSDKKYDKIATAMTNVVNTNLEADNRGVIIEKAENSILTDDFKIKPIYIQKVPRRRLNVIPDAWDGRDVYFKKEKYQEIMKTTYDGGMYINPILDKVPVRNQGSEGSCTGHSVVSAGELMLARGSIDFRTPDDVKYELSERWAYEHAKLYDPWPGELYEGSTVRAAVKAWAKHGICLERDWRYVARLKGRPEICAPYNAEFVKINSYARCWPNYYGDLKVIIEALNNFGVVITGATTHPGWQTPVNAIIPFNYNMGRSGGHAFAIVGYSRIGFLVRNSWGSFWGLSGYAWLTYCDAQINLTDVWVVSDPNEFQKFDIKEPPNCE